MSETRPARRTTSWPVATWVAPLVPTLALLLLAALDDRTAVASRQSSGYPVGLGLAVLLAVAGAVLTRVGSPPLRGLGWGLVAGAVATALVLLVLVVT